MSHSLPPIVAGPILRKVTPEAVTVWLVTSYPCTPVGRLFLDDQSLESAQDAIQLQVGQHAFIHLLTLHPQAPLPCDERVEYDIEIDQDEKATHKLTEWLPHICYAGQTRPGFIVRKHLSNILHGSCRKPHFDGGDGLVQVDHQIADALEGKSDYPDLLVMSGDQIYADDVAGPTLVAIHQVITLLGLFDEKLDGTIVSNGHDLIAHEYSYYKRSLFLADDVAGETVYAKFFAAKRKPLFTSANADNHLVTLAEVIAMYMLVWSPALWEKLEINDKQIAEDFKQRFHEENGVIERFVQTLPDVQRALANIPVYMIFDDHDVTDDWNLTRGWEEAIYNHPFGRRIVGNALIGYWLCQGLGNQVDKFTSLLEDSPDYFTPQGVQQQDALIDRLLDWDQWHYHLDTHPKLVVLDTRTQRWRSESSLNKPSGLMDWEALCELQQELINQPAVIMVSPAPVFGVKLIETIQKIFTFFGKALTVDAENWMAHKGTASVILNIFTHIKTPPQFIILSGDVHYSFVYDISLRFRRNSPHITQITSSGIKNEFPAGLLVWLDKLNRILYGGKSLLNWFTQRRYMKIQHRRPQGQQFRTLLNHSGIGKVTLNAECTDVRAVQLCTNGEAIEFVANKAASAED